MTPTAPTLRPEWPVRRAAAVVGRCRVSAALVLDDRHRVVGIVSESDLLCPPGPGRRTVSQVMSRHVRSVAEHADLATIIDLMLRANVTNVPVMRGARPVGLVRRRDVFTAVRNERALGPGAPRCS